MGKTYFITGTNRGIGLELVRHVSNEDPTNIILATVRDPTKVTGDLSKLIESNKNIKIITLDLSQEDSVNAVDSQVTSVAPQGIDIFINNAAISNSHESLLDAPWDVYTDHFLANTVGPLKLTKALKPHLLKGHTRQILFVTTLLASMASEYSANTGTVYPLSKAALNLGVKSTASELKGDGFTVVAIEPGVCDTDMFNDGFAASKHLLPLETQEFILSLSKPAKDAAKGFIDVVKKISVEDNGKWYSWDGSLVDY